MIFLRGRGIEPNHLGWRKCVQEERCRKEAWKMKGEEVRQDSKEMD